MPKRTGILLHLILTLLMLWGCQSDAGVTPSAQGSNSPQPHISVTISPILPSIVEIHGNYLAELTGRESAQTIWTMESSNRNSRFYGVNAIDGDRATGWMPRFADERPSIILSFDEPNFIHAIAMLPGDQANPSNYNASGKPKEIELVFEDGSSEHFLLPATAFGEIWIGEFSARQTKTVELLVDQVEGIRPFVISELAYLTAAAPPAGEPIISPTSQPVATAAPTGPGKDITGFTPSWFTWEDDGSALHKSDTRFLLAGQWVDATGTTVLYCDYLTSADLCAYEMVWQGNTIYRDGAIQLKQDDPLRGVCQTHKIRFKSEGYGVMDVTNPDDGMTTRLYLVRVKYSRLANDCSD